MNDVQCYEQWIIATGLSCCWPCRTALTGHKAQPNHAIQISACCLAPTFINDATANVLDCVLLLQYPCCCNSSLQHLYIPLLCLLSSASASAFSKRLKVVLQSNRSRCALVANINCWHMQNGTSSEGLDQEKHACGGSLCSVPYLTPLQHSSSATLHSTTLPVPSPTPKVADRAHNVSCIKTFSCICLTFACLDMLPTTRLWCYSLTCNATYVGTRNMQAFWPTPMPQQLSMDRFTPHHLSHA